MKLKLIIFDFDGTLANSLPTLFKSYNNKIAGKYSLPHLTEKDLQKTRDGDFKEYLKKYFRWWKYILLAPQLKSISNELGTNLPIYDGIKEMLQKLTQTKIPLAIVTSNSSTTVKKFIKRHQIDYFKFVESKFATMDKTSVLKRILNINKFQPKEVIYIGDTIEDIESCKKLKIPIIAVTWGLNSKKALQKYNPEVMVESIQDLQQILLDRI